MQVAARLYATLFEVFFPMSKVEDYAWHRNFLSGQRTFLGRIPRIPVQIRAGVECE